MKQTSIEEYLEKYSYLKDMTEYTLFITQEDMKTIRNSETISISGREVYVEFLRRIVKDETYFGYANRLLSGKTSRFCVSYIIEGDTAGTLNYDKAVIVRGIKELIETRKLELTPEEQQRFETLSKYISYYRFKELIKYKDFDISIDGREYSIPIEDLVSLMEMPDEEYDRLCSDPDKKEINGIPKEHYIYAAYKYFRDNKVLLDFDMPPIFEHKYKTINSLQLIDLQALNKFLETSDKMYQKVELDPSLREAILSGMPDIASDLDKAIYIYIKMCKVLTYDEEYYAVAQKGPATLKHKNIDYVPSITPDNNKVVCFEFNLIYSKLLSELGINFQTDYKNMMGEAYGVGHANLEFRTGKFLVKADSVTSILQGDIMRAKLNEPLIGLTCINRNRNTQEEFARSLTRVYKLVAGLDNTLDEKGVEHIETFEEIMDEYARTTDNIKPVSIEEKVSILLDKVRSKQLIGIDLLSYLLQLKKILFNEQERDIKVGVSVIRNNVTDEEDRYAEACAIISVNPNGFNESPEDTTYYYLTSIGELMTISKSEIQAKYDEGRLEYIESDDPRIPGITEAPGVSKK